MSQTVTTSGIDEQAQWLAAHIPGLTEHQAKKLLHVKCFINSHQVLAAELGYRNLGFGQPVPDLETQEYRLIFDAPEFLDCLQADYTEFLEDQREDDRRVSEPHPKYFRDLGYPDLRRLMHHPAEFADSIRNFLHEELLGACLGAEAEIVRWVVNSIDHVRVEKDKVIVQGQAYSVPSLHSPAQRGDVNLK